jgi:hypothetical protein
MSQAAPNFPLLNNENYPEWRDNMTSWLQSLGLWRLVKGSKLKPEDPLEADKWEDDQLKAAGWLKRMVERGQRAHFKDVQDDPIVKCGNSTSIIMDTCSGILQIFF